VNKKKDVMDENIIKMTEKEWMAFMSLSEEEREERAKSLWEDIPDGEMGTIVVYKEIGSEELDIKELDSDLFMVWTPEMIQQMAKEKERHKRILLNSIQKLTEELKNGEKET